MPKAHAEAVQALLSIIEAEGWIATDAQRAQADLLVAAVEARDLARATVLFQMLLGFTGEPFRQAPLGCR